MPKLFLSINFSDEFGQSIGTKAIQLDDETVDFGDRISNVRPPALDATFDDAVRIMKVKKFRRDLFIREATRLGDALADHLEDKEGWHGERRQELVTVKKDPP